jgi:molybdate transport system ATP-binding protein
VSDVLHLDLSVPLDRFSLRVEWETSEPSLGVFGPSGAGKTTLVEAIAGLRRGATGVIRWRGRTWLDSARGVRLPPERRGVGYVPQDALLFPHRDVTGNLLAGCRRAAGAGRPAPPVERVLEVLELAPLRRRDVGTLSGGERKRVALGRALCSGASLLLLDEPLAGLDLPLRRRILSYLLRVRDEFAVPTLVVSHDAVDIRLLSREMIVLSGGAVAARGRPEEVLARPEIFPVARAEGFENILSGAVTAIDDGSAVVSIEPGLTLTVPGRGLAPGDRVSVGLRAEDLILAVQPPAGLSAQIDLPGTLRDLRDADGEEGPVVLAIVELGRDRLPVVAAITRQAVRRLDLRPGMAVHLIGKTQACRLLALSS